MSGKRKAKALAPSQDRADVMVAVVAAAAYDKDAVVAERFGISERTVKRYRLEVSASPELSRRARLAIAAQGNIWVDRATRCMTATLETMETLAGRIATDPTAYKNPELLRALGENFRIIAEAQLTAQVVYDRLRLRSGEQADSAHRPGLAAPAGTGNDG